MTDNTSIRSFVFEAFVSFHSINKTPEAFAAEFISALRSDRRVVRISLVVPEIFSLLLVIKRTKAFFPKYLIALILTELGLRCDFSLYSANHISFFSCEGHDAPKKIAKSFNGLQALSIFMVGAQSDEEDCWLTGRTYPLRFFLLNQLEAFTGKSEILTLNLLNYAHQKDPACFSKLCSFYSTFDCVPANNELFEIITRAVASRTPSEVYKLWELGLISELCCELFETFQPAFKRESFEQKIEALSLLELEALEKEMEIIEKKIDNIAVQKKKGPMISLFSPVKLHVQMIKFLKSESSILYDF